MARQGGPAPWARAPAGQPPSALAGWGVIRIWFLPRLHLDGGGPGGPCLGTFVKPALVLAGMSDKGDEGGVWQR